MTQRYIDLAFDDTSPRSFGGFDNENEATVIRLKVLDPDAKYYIEIEQACDKHDKYCSDALPVADGYAVFEVSRDFTHETLYVQGVMKVDGVCRKTARVRVGFNHSINALDELPESHPSWADSVDERLNELEQSSVIPDWNQNDESAQDYIKNRTHWKEENTEKYEKLKLTSYLQNDRLHFYSLGGQVRFGGAVDFSVYPFSLRYGGDPIYSDKIPLTTLLLTSLAYTSCSGMSVYDEKEQLIGHFQFDALIFTAANDTYYTIGLLEVPYNFDTAYTVVLEPKPVYHKIPQEYLPEIVLYSEQTLTEKQKSQARTNIGAEKAGTGYSKPASGIPKTDLAGDVQTSLDLADKALQAVPDTYRTAVVQDELDAVKQPRKITDVGGHFGENPTVESALQQLGGALILRTWTD